VAHICASSGYPVKDIFDYVAKLEHSVIDMRSQDCCMLALTKPMLESLVNSKWEFVKKIIQINFVTKFLLVALLMMRSYLRLAMQTLSLPKKISDATAISSN
jgi:hypothetical protein